MKTLTVCTLILGTILTSASALAFNRANVDELNFSIEKCFEQTQLGQEGSTRACNDIIRSDVVSRHNKAIALHNRGVIKLAKGEKEAALSDFMAATRRVPENVESLLAAAHVYHQLNQIENAKMIMAKVSSIDSKDALFKQYQAKLNLLVERTE